MMNDSLKEQIKKILKQNKSLYKVTDDNLQVGSIILLPLSADDNGFVVKDGACSATKFIVVVGKTDDYFSVSTFLINSKSYNYTPEMQRCQFPLNESDYKEILNHKSYLNCAKIFIIEKERLKTNGKFLGVLKPDDLKLILDFLRSDDYPIYSKKELQKFGVI